MMRSRSIAKLLLASLRKMIRHFSCVPPRIDQLLRTVAHDRKAMRYQSKILRTAFPMVRVEEDVEFLVVGVKVGDLSIRWPVFEQHKQFI